MTCQRSSELKGNDLNVSQFLANQEENYYEDLIACRKQEKIDSIFQRFSKYSSFQGNVLVSWKGRIIYDNSHGYANPRKKGEPLNQQSAFQLASVSKQFTAMAIMILKEQGKLDFDDDVRKYIPRWPYENMTIRHLLNHTSGLQNYMWLLEHKWKGDTAPYNNQVISMLIENKLPLNYTPGKYFAYSNTGYVVLAYLVEVISGDLFADFLDQNIFKPLGMNHSFAYSSTLHNEGKHKLMGYRRYWRGYREIPETVNDGCIGDKGIYSTTMDLYKWDQALYTETLVSKETLEEAFSKATLKNHRHVSYGFGFRIEEEDGHKVIYHNGLWNGFRTSIMRYVDDSSAIIVLNHTNSNAKHHLVRKLEKILLEDENLPENTQLANSDVKNEQTSL